MLPKHRYANATYAKNAKEQEEQKQNATTTPPAEGEDATSESTTEDRSEGIIKTVRQVIEP
jgi:hypothetical protein